MKTYQINELNDNIDNMTLVKWHEVTLFDFCTYNFINAQLWKCCCCNVVCSSILKCQCHENEPLNGFKRIAMIFFSRFVLKTIFFNHFFYKKNTIFHHFHHSSWHVVGLHHGVPSRTVVGLLRSVYPRKTPQNLSLGPSPRAIVCIRHIISR